MDLQKRSDMLAKAKKMLSDKSESAKIRKDGKKTAYDLMNLLFDDGTFSETGAFVKAYANEIGTTDPAEYEGVVCGYGAVDGRLVFAYAQDISRTNGAFSKAAAGKITALYDLAVKNGAPVVSMLDSIGAKSILRCPIIPGLNDRPEHLAGIASLANRLRNIIEIDIEPYHPLGAAKCLRLGREYPMNRQPRSADILPSTDSIPSPDTVTHWVEAIRAETHVLVCC